eukprot:2920654-Ditylum_brightwellii.AAC.1
MKASMQKYIQELIDGFPEELCGACTSPTADHLFQVNEEEIKLCDKKAQQYHTTVTRMLFVCKRARPDIQPTIVFLTTRIREPDEDNWKKLCHLLMYLKETINMVLPLLSDNMHV